MKLAPRATPDGRFASGLHSATLLLLAGLALWVAAALAVQRWFSWADAERHGPGLGFGVDMRAYELIARAAPSFPDTRMYRAYAERFPVHWLVGLLADATGVGLRSLYDGAELLCLALVLALLYAALRPLRLTAGEQLLALGAFVASAYPVHYLLAAPGVLSDGLFLLGLSLCLLGFVRGSFALVLTGLVLGVLGRQTAVPVAFAAALWVAFAPAWRQRRYVYAAVTALLPLGIWLALHFGTMSFSYGERGGVHALTVVGYFSDLGGLAGHVGRVVVAVVVPSALVAGAWLRTRGDVPRGALLLTAVIVVQPLLLGPTSGGDNEPRLAALSLPALVIAAGALLRGARLRTWETGAIAVALFAGGLHHRYTRVGLDRPGWLALELLGSVVILAVLARPAGWAAPVPPQTA